MKKIIVLAAVILGFSVAAAAQPRAIGVRVGNGGEISYQHTLGQNFLEVDGGLGLGFDGVFNIGATGIYNFMIALTLGAAGMVGLEYTFWFPLQLSVDFRQHIGFSRGENPLWTPSSIALSVRYRF